MNVFLCSFPFISVFFENDGNVNIYPYYIKYIQAILTRKVCSNKRWHLFLRGRKKHISSQCKPSFQNTIQKKNNNRNLKTLREKKIVLFFNFQFLFSLFSSIERIYIALHFYYNVDNNFLEKLPIDSFIYSSIKIYTHF